MQMTFHGPSPLFCHDTLCFRLLLSMYQLTSSEAFCILLAFSSCIRSMYFCPSCSIKSFSIWLSSLPVFITMNALTMIPTIQLTIKNDICFPLSFLHLQASFLPLMACAQSLLKVIPAHAILYAVCITI